MGVTVGVGAGVRAGVGVRIRAAAAAAETAARKSNPEPELQTPKTLNPRPFTSRKNTKTGQTLSRSSQNPPPLSKPAATRLVVKPARVLSHALPPGRFERGV